MADDSTSAPRSAPAKANGPAPKAPPASDAKASDTAASSGAKTGGVTDSMAEEYAARGVNAALDNRTGDQAPTAGAFRAKPQQFPGPEVGHFAEHAEKYGDEFRAATERDGDADVAKGVGGGPHGREPRNGPSSAGADGEPGSDASPV